MNERLKRIPPAFKHGAFSGTSLLPGEDPDAFKKLHDDLIVEFDPKGPLEEDIVETMARLTWRKKNMSTYRFAEIAKQRVEAIKSETIPPVELDCDLTGLHRPDTRNPEKVRADKKAADERAKKELGPLLELVEMDGNVTIERLLQEWSIIDRLDGMIDRCIKRLLLVRGVKSMSPSVSEASSPPRKRLNSA